MRIERLVTERFRNLAGGELDFSPGVNVLVGDNGQGKTNLLEAIDWFTFGRSFRTRRDVELIRFDEPFARIVVTVRYDAGDRETFAATITREGERTVRVAGKPLERRADLVGRYPCVRFGPDDVDVVSREPALRRAFVDSVGSLVDPAYLRVARQARRVLRQRNAALRARSGAATVDALTAQLVEAGALLVRGRLDVVARLGEALAEAAQEAAVDVPVTLALESAVHQAARGAAASGSAAEAGTAVDAPSPEAIGAAYAGLLERRAEEERARGTTLVGPHRDDVRIRLGEVDLRRYGSQGQRRLVALLLRMAQMRVVERALGERCVLLLDDVFAEFDPHVTRRLQALLDGHRQVFVTSPAPLEWHGEARMLHVVQGHVTPGP